MKVSNINCRDMVQNRIEFKGSNLFGELRGEKYFVFSYGHHWILYAYVDGVWYENKEKYSRTTSKHTSQARPNIDTVLLSKEDIHKLY